MNEEFKPRMPTPGVKRFQITDDGMIYDRRILSYTGMTPIAITSPPSRMTNGLAATSSFGETITLTYTYKDRDRAAYAFQFANDRIEYPGKPLPFRYRIMGYTGTMLEVYDDHVLIRFMEASGLANLRNGNKPSCKKIKFSDIRSVQLQEPEKNTPGFLRIVHKKNADQPAPELAKDSSAVPVSSYSLETAREIQRFLRQALESAQES